MAVPTAVGWYAVRIPHPSGMHVLRTIYCFPDRHGALACEDGGALQHVAAPFYAGAEWTGPFVRREEADDACVARRGPTRPK